MYTGLEPWAAIGITLLLAIAAAVGSLLVAHGLGPSRRGPVKDSAYESGMPLIQDTVRRFNVRFYIVAMLFLLFDVEVVFLWPWAQAFYAAAMGGVAVPVEGGLAGKGFLLAGMALFFALLVFGLVYEWARGAFRWND